MVQWLEVHLPVQGTWVWSLVQEDSMGCGATKACAPQWMSLCSKAWALQLEKAWALQWSPCEAEKKKKKRSVYNLKNGRKGAWKLGFEEMLEPMFKGEESWNICSGVLGNNDNWWRDEKMCNHKCCIKCTLTGLFMTECLRDCNTEMCFIKPILMRVCSGSQTYFTAETTFFQWSSTKK